MAIRYIDLYRKQIFDHMNNADVLEYIHLVVRQQLNQDVYIALRAVLAAGDGAEERSVRDAMGT